MKIDRSPSPIIPGDDLGVIEEFEGGTNTYVSDGNVRSSAVGFRIYDIRKRIVKIQQSNSPALPKIGDVVVGYVDMLFGSMFSIRIIYINNVRTFAGISAIASTKMVQNNNYRDRDGRRSKYLFRVGDIVRGRVFSLLNSNIHIAIDEKELGLLYTLCYNCGNDTLRSHNGIKCPMCGTYEDRKITIDYGKETFSNIQNMT